MDDVTLSAFADELEKISALSFKGLWSKFTGLFDSPEERKTKSKVDYHFSPRAGLDKWNKFSKNVRDKKFLQRLSQHPDADPKLVQHAKGMHELSRGTTINKIQSSASPGATYEIRKTPTGFACTCNDWRFKGSVNPGYDCKHIKAHKAGKVKAEDELQ